MAYLITIALPIVNRWRLCEEEFWRWGLRLIIGRMGIGGDMAIKNAIPFQI